MTSPDTQWGPEMPSHGVPSWAKPPFQAKYLSGIWLDHDQYGVRAFPQCVTAIRFPADHPHYQQAEADTVTVRSITSGEAMALFKRYTGRDIVPLNMFVELGVLKPESDIDRFMAANPDADRATAEKALKWGREGA
jgi:hypothetical protein